MDPEHADAYVHGGSIRVARAASYLGDKTVGIRTPDEVRHRVSHGFPAGVSASRYANGFGAVYVTDGPIDGEFIRFASEHNWTKNHMVLCLSNSASPDVRDALDKPNARVFLIAKPNVLIKCISERLGCDPIYGEVKYTDAPDRGAFTKGLDSSEQREFRFAWDYEGPEDEVLVEIPKGVGEEIDVTALNVLLPPRIIPTGGISLSDYCARGNGMARISAMVLGDVEWLAELEEQPSEP